MNYISKQNFKHFRSKKVYYRFIKNKQGCFLNVFEGKVNKVFPNFSNEITYILDKHVPVTKISLKEMKSSNKS